MEPALIYNLFPRLAGTIDRWPGHAHRARDLGFNWIYLNPVSFPGFSGSLYAVKNHFRLCPDFLPRRRRGNADGMPELKQVLGEFRSLGLKTAMDLVINHTAIDSPLAREHPEWYRHDGEGSIVHPRAIDPADSRKITVWGDLAEIDNRQSPDREALWAYWKTLVRFFLELGFDGFRCDAAYQVPAELWRLLIAEARRVKPDATFFAETLGCRIEEVKALDGVGFDYLFNSSKYWNFDAPWALTQHEDFGKIQPSVSFPESHDTGRLAQEVDGDLAVIRQRYFFSALFSKGLMIPIGFEFAFRKNLDVVRSRPADWEETGVDLSAFIRAVNHLKVDLPVLRQEGHWESLAPYDAPVLPLRRTEGGDRLLVVINKLKQEQQPYDLRGLDPPLGGSLLRVGADGTIHSEPVPHRITLEPAEIVLLQ